MSWFQSFCSDGLIITDGAWGTEFQKLGLGIGEPSDFWNLARPGDVESVARSYVEAGSRVILTNTFRSNAVALTSATSAGEIAELNRRGAELSRRAAGSDVRVFGSMGPTGKLLATGEIDAGAVGDAFREQAAALASGGVDALLLETFSDLEEARLAVRAVKDLDLPIVVSFAFDSGKNKDRTMMGVKPEAAGAAMAEEGASAVGANCGAGPEAFAEVCRRLKEASGLPVWIKPNAGLPTLEAGRPKYTMDPEAFATFLPALAAAGASFLGGCCGTSPAYIQALLKASRSCASS
ncbi:MAG: homocysteine S-methyltransferase family protein [Isosphaeraceae bacterium]